MHTPLVVQKYGGTSVGTVERIRHVAEHISATVRSGHRVVAVVSAMGEQTDELLALAHTISPHPPRRELDMLLTSGERITMALVSIALNDLGTMAVSLTGSQSGIVTDTTHGNARISAILGQRIESNLSHGSVVIVAGFQGVSKETKEITTLGRGGSDLSAIALAGHLKADACQLYKDVDGVCTADPRIVPDARKIDRLSWNEMTEMAWCGASVLHPRGAHLAAKFQIPIEIRNSFYLDRPGTIVTGYSSMEEIVVTAVTHRKNMAIVSGQSSGHDQSGLNALRLWLWEQGETPQVQIQMSEVGVTKFRWSMPQKFVTPAMELLKSKAMLLGEPTSLECGLITMVGSGFWQSPELVSKVQNVVPSPLFMEIKNSSLTIGVDPNLLDETVVGLHKLVP